MNILFNNLLEYSFHKQIHEFKEKLSKSCSGESCAEKLDKLYPVFEKDAIHYENNCYLALFIILLSSAAIFLFYFWTVKQFLPQKILIIFTSSPSSP